MTQALYTSMTGLNAGTEQLTVVSDNVANMNTTAYKTSRVDFQDIWYQTSTSGTNSTAVSGGTNPYQIGVGVQCSSITKDMSASSVTTTGYTTDMAIQGSGWFTILSTDGAVLYTRDGTFSLDEEGYLVTSNGYKVLGMTSTESTTASTTAIKLPTSIQVIEEATPESLFKEMSCDELNCVDLTTGYFYVTATDGSGNAVKLAVFCGTGSDGTVNDISDYDVEGLVDSMSYCYLVDSSTGEVDTSTVYSTSDYFTVDIIDGALTFTPAGNYSYLDFSSGGTSNFVKQAGLSGMTLINGCYTTDTLNLSATITEVDDVTDENTKQYSSFSVGYDGLVTVTYSDGSVLTVSADDDGNTYFSYTNAEGIIINDDVQNSGNASLYVDPNVLVKANMQMQFAKVTNDNGLVAIGNNLYQAGVNCGDILYTASNSNGVGSVVTGALEASNVDLASQFSAMILAQRLVQANSQVFSAANSMLETLVYLGQ